MWVPAMHASKDFSSETQSTYFSNSPTIDKADSVTERAFQ